VVSGQLFVIQKLDDGTKARKADDDEQLTTDD